MKIRIDMNLSPEWVQEFKLHKIAAAHWSEGGQFDAQDMIIMDWARKNEYTVFTHDLDFGTALALTRAEKPSVIQVRTQNVTGSHLSGIIIPILNKYAELIKKALYWLSKKTRNGCGYCHCSAPSYKRDLRIVGCKEIKVATSVCVHKVRE